MRRTGVIADDFTGATDIASGYVARGHRATVVTDPSAVAGLPDDVDVVVVALKTRTSPVDVAVARSLDALEALQGAHCRQFVLKYCSTFDSTDQGNIGAVLDALADRLGADVVTVVPAFPDNGRTVYQGHLFVGADLLEHSSMRHHPLTPMTRSRVADILRPQTRSTVAEVHLATVRGAARLDTAISDAGARYVVVDAVDDHDLARISEAVAEHVLVSGAAGVALGVTAGSADPTDAVDAPSGGRLVVCGSASARTREQIAAATAAGCPMRQIDVARAVTARDDIVDETVAWLRGLPADAPPPVVYTVGTLDDLAGQDLAGDIEAVIAGVVRSAVRTAGIGSIIVAGGETSGAVVSALGIDRLDIGPAIAPGVCWSGARTDDGTSVALALKSGNFGTEDMFTTAWEALR